MIRRIRVPSAKNIINFSNYVNHRMVVQKRFYSQNTNQTNTKSLKSAILLLGLGGVGYGIGRIRREFVNEQEVAFREISSEDLGEFININQFSFCIYFLFNLIIISIKYIM